MDLPRGFLILAFLCFILSLLFRIVKSVFFSPLKAIPGPFLAKITSYYRVYLTINGSSPLNSQKLHKRYGPVVRIGPNHILTSDPRAIPVIYDTRSKFLKSQFYNVFTPLYKGEPMVTVFSTQSPARNAELRKPLLSHMSGTKLRLFESTIEKAADSFVSRMEVMKCQPVDMQNWAQYWTFDLTADLIFDGPFGFMSKGGDIHGILDALNKGLRYGVVVGQVPEWHPWLIGNKKLMELVPKYTNLADPTVKIFEAVEERIAEFHVKNNTDGDSLMCNLFRKYASSSNSLSYTDIVNNLFNTFIAASGAVAMTINAAMYYLIKNPHCYEKLVQLIRDPKQQDPISVINPRISYLDAVVLESMRLCPANSVPLERIVPSGGLIVQNYYLPEGTNVSMSSYVVHRDPNIYGDDIDNFRPERWIDASPEELDRMEQCYLAFGRGSRGCIGRKLAMLEMQKFLISIFRAFDIEWASPEQDWKLKMYWLVEQHGFLVRFVPR